MIFFLLFRISCFCNDNNICSCYTSHYSCHRTATLSNSLNHMHAACDETTLYAICKFVCLFVPYRVMQLCTSSSSTTMEQRTTSHMVALTTPIHYRAIVSYRTCQVSSPSSIEIWCFLHRASEMVSAIC